MEYYHRGCLLDILDAHPHVRISESEIAYVSEQVWCFLFILFFLRRISFSNKIVLLALRCPKLHAQARENS